MQKVKNLFMDRAYMDFFGPDKIIPGVQKESIRYLNYRNLRPINISLPFTFDMCQSCELIDRAINDFLYIDTCVPKLPLFVHVTKPLLQFSELFDTATAQLITSSPPSRRSHIRS